MRLILVSTTIAISALFVSLSNAGLEDIAECDGCWCIPEPGESCPADMPQINFTEVLLTNLRTIPLENPIDLTCNPYQEENCEANPPLEDGGACVAEIIAPTEDSSTCPQEYSYR
jgi:hypothetical protein